MHHSLNAAWDKAILDHPYLRVIVKKPNNLNSEGKRKTGWVSADSSYPDRINVQFALLIIDSYWFFNTSVYVYSTVVQIYLFRQLDAVLR